MTSPHSIEDSCLLRQVMGSPVAALRGNKLSEYHRRTDARTHNTCAQASETNSERATNHEDSADYCKNQQIFNIPRNRQRKNKGGIGGSFSLRKGIRDEDRFPQQAVNPFAAGERTADTARASCSRPPGGRLDGRPELNACVISNIDLSSI